VEKRVVVKVSVTVIEGPVEVDNRVRVVVGMRASDADESIEMELSTIGLPREVDNKVSVDTGIGRRADVEKRVKTEVSVTVFEPLTDVDSEVNVESGIREAEVENRVESEVSIAVKGSRIDVESEVTAEDASVSIIDIESLTDVDSVDTGERREWGDVEKRVMMDVPVEVEISVVVAVGTRQTAFPYRSLMIDLASFKPPVIKACLLVGSLSRPHCHTIQASPGGDSIGKIICSSALTLHCKDVKSKYTGIKSSFVKVRIALHRPTGFSTLRSVSSSRAGVAANLHHRDHRTSYCWDWWIGYAGMSHRVTRGDDKR
jgi:hypothetical protein